MKHRLRKEPIEPLKMICAKLCSSVTKSLIDFSENDHMPESLDQPVATILEKLMPLLLDSGANH